MAAPSPPAQAGRPPFHRVNRLVSGPFQGPSGLAQDARCPFFYFWIDASYTTVSGRTGQLRLDGCIVLTPQEPYGYEGDFTLTAPSGGVLRGTFTGDWNPLDLTLTVASTEGRLFRHVGGTLALTGLAAHPITQGTLTGALTRGRP